MLRTELEQASEEQRGFRRKINIQNNNFTLKQIIKRKIEHIEKHYFAFQFRESVASENYTHLVFARYAFLRS